MLRRLREEIQSRLYREAITDLQELYEYIAERRSAARASRYVERLQRWIAELRRFPTRGTIRKDIREGIRVVGFERRVSIAFRVGSDEVVIFRILYAGRDVDTAL